ncbi:MAG: TonB-dependent receptor [Bacteroidota bacterium]
MKSTLLFLLLLPSFAFGQLDLRGTLHSAAGPIAYANVILRDTNAQFVAGVLSDAEGHFVLQAEKGTYVLQVRHMNFEQLEKRIHLEKALDLGRIVLQPDASQLETVDITAQKSLIRREIDKTVVSIEGSPLANSGTVFDALRTVPGLVVQNDAIAMLGKSSVRIAVDGRLVELSGAELNDFLRSLAADEIKEVEVMTNPPARYAAEGNSGIVNIITKRIQKNAWRNHLSATHHQAKYGWQQFNHRFSFQKKKISLLLSTAANTGRRWIAQTVAPSYSENPQRIESRQIRGASSLSPRLQLDYALNPQTTLGFQYMAHWGRVRQTDDLSTTIFDADFSPQQYLFAQDVQFDQDRNNASYNLYYDQRLDTLGRRLTLNLDFLDYNGSTHTNVWSERFDNALNFLDVEFANQGDATYTIDNYNAKLDVEHPLDALRLSYGARSSFSRTAYAIDNFNTLSGAPVFMPHQSNRFDFKEQIHAAYVNAFKPLSDHLELQVGLRTEYTQTLGQSSADETRFENEYLKLFPTFYARYTPNDKHVLALNYGRRINRPAYSQLNPARSFLSGQSSQQGNPFLLPSFSHNLELTHTFRQNLSTTLTLRRTTGGYAFLFDLDDATQQQNITYKNLFHENNISLMTSYQLNLAPWWTGQALLFYSYSHSRKINPADDVALMNGGGLYSSLRQRFAFNKARTLHGELNFWYMTPFKANLYRFDESSALDLALSWQSLLKGLTLTLSAHDIFDKSPRAVTSVVNGVQHRFIARPSNRYVKLSIAYGFGREGRDRSPRAFGNEEVRGRSE